MTAKREILWSYLEDERNSYCYFLLLLVIMLTSTPVVAPYLFMGVVIIFMADLFLIKQKEKKERKVEEILSRDKFKQDLNVDQYGGET